MTRNCDTPLRAYIALRCQLNRAMDSADEGDWEECLASVDEARLTLDRLGRMTRKPARAAEVAAEGAAA